MTVERVNHLGETVIIDADEQDVTFAAKFWDSNLNDQRLLDLAAQHGIQKDQDGGRWIWATVKLMAEERYRKRTGAWSEEKKRQIEMIGQEIESQ